MKRLTRIGFAVNGRVSIVISSATSATQHCLSHQHRPATTPLVNEFHHEAAPSSLVLTERPWMGKGWRRILLYLSAVKKSVKVGGSKASKEI